MYLPSEDNTICVRLLRPGFEYPTGVFKHHDALYYPSEDAVFLVTKRRSSNYGDDVYTEIAIWDPDEIRLLGTLTLSIPEGGGWITFAPWHYSLYLRSDGHHPFLASFTEDLNHTFFQIDIVHSKPDKLAGTEPGIKQHQDHRPVAETGRHGCINGF